MTTSKPRCYSYIRFSRPEQIAGDSLNRQLRLSQEYAQKKGLILDESLNLRDLGLSAYTGEHRTKGALGKFFELVENGDIAKRSILIVESLDRLSREQVLDAFSQFHDIIKKGITIVTLTDNKEYNIKALNTNPQDLMFSLMIMSRAHEESLIKSQRLRSSWKSKRNNISNRKLTARAPAWLKLDRRNNEFIPIPDRAKLVQRIFKKYLNGVGPALIAKQLNLKKHTWKLKNGWRKSYIMKILRNKAVIGEFQPHEIKASKRTPVGDPIKYYFPQVISDNDFYRVQEKLASNVNRGGKTGKISNLFSYVANCGYCGATMQYVNKGNGWVYLVCDNKRRGRGCIDASYKYDEFEKAFLEFCSGLSLAAILPNWSDQTKQIKAIRGQSEAIRGELKDTNTQIKNFDYQVSVAKSKKGIEHATVNLEKVLDKRETLSAQLDKVESKLKKLLEKDVTAETQLQSVQQLLHLMDNVDGDARIELRRKLRNEIRQLVKRIEIFPHGLVNKMLSLEDLTPKYIDHTDSVLSYFKQMGYDTDHFPSEKAYEEAFQTALNEVTEYLEENSGKQHRRFAITFAAGGFKEVIHQDGKYEVGQAGDNSFEILSSISKASKQQ